ncbi:hypothetical protein ACQP3J_31955, partial [Escherichia coli]
LLGQMQRPDGCKNRKQMPEASNKAATFGQDWGEGMMTEMKWETWRKRNKMLNRRKERLRK